MLDKLLFLIKAGMFVVVFLTALYIAGYVISRWLKRSYNFCSCILVGFVFQLAFFELIALPFLLVKGSFYRMITVFGIFLAVAYGLFLGMLLWWFQKKRMVSPLAWMKSRLQERKKQKWMGLQLFPVLFFVLLLVHVAGVTVHQVTMGDDTYYVTMATYAMDHDSLETNTMYITTGLYQQPDIRPAISAWEYFVAFLSVIFRFHPAQMFHFLLPLVLIPMSYMAYREVICALFKKEKVAPFMMWFAILNLFFSFSNKLNSYNMFNCPWMGKVVLYNILMPFFLVTCISIIKEKDNLLKYWICLVFTMCAGVCTTVVGIYMIPIYYAAIGLTYVCTMRSWEEFRKLLIPVLVTVIPVLVVVVIIFSSKMGKNILAYSAFQPKNWMAVFRNYWGISIRPVLGWIALLLFCISCIVIWIREDKTVRIVLCGLTIVVSATLVNPLLIKPVSQYITGVDLYWRMFILLPVVYVLPYLFVEFSLFFSKRKYVTVLLAVVIAFGGNALDGNAFSDPEIFQPYENTYGIPQKCVEVSNYLLKETRHDKRIPNVLYPPKLIKGMRQYTTKLNTWMARKYYQKLVPTPCGNMGDVYRNLYHNGYSEKEAYQVLKKLQVDYIVVPKRIHYKDTRHFEKRKKIGRFRIYKVKKQG